MQFIDIDGKRFLWRGLLQRRREQLAAAAKLEQPVLKKGYSSCIGAYCRRTLRPSPACSRSSSESDRLERHAADGGIYI
jgi:hypothetical protein